MRVDKIELAVSPKPTSRLLNFLMSRVLVAVGAKLSQLKSVRRSATVFAGGIARNAVRTFVGVRSTFGTFQRDCNTVALFSHDA